MAEIDLDAIRALFDETEDCVDWKCDPMDAAAWVPALLAEVDRLRAANANLIHNAEVLADELVHASAEREAMRAQLDKPCGSCHPCTNWPAETWRQAGRRLPDVHRYGELVDELAKIKAFGEWIVALDEPGGEDRRTVTLNLIITRAREALGGGSDA